MSGVTDHISALRRYEVKHRPDGTLGVVLEQKYTTTEYVVDVDQAAGLSKSLAEAVAQQREQPETAAGVP